MGRIFDAVARHGMVRQGSSGETVKLVQEALASAGYPLSEPPTGYFGSLTDTAVESFQRASGLDADGVVGMKTATALDQVEAGEPLHTPDLARPPWLVAGMTQLGVHEDAGAANDPQIMEWADEVGGAVAKAYAADAIPWCALFANWCLTRAGLKGTGTLWALHFDDVGMWPNVKLAGPAVGAFMPMRREGGGHITICVGRMKVGRTWYLAGLGGNQSDAVTIAAFPKDRPLAFRWPASFPEPARQGFDDLPVVDVRGKVSTQES